MIESKFTSLIKNIRLIYISYALNWIKNSILGLTETMETLNFENPVDLWESWDDRGKLHVSYSVYVNMIILSIYGA